MSQLGILDSYRFYPTDVDVRGSYHFYPTEDYQPRKLSRAVSPKSLARIDKSTAGILFQKHLKELNVGTTARVKHLQIMYHLRTYLI